MRPPLPEPTDPASGRSELFLDYLDYFRLSLLDRLNSLPAAELNRSRLPSGWTPLQLLKHLTQVEVRWLEWGFCGRVVPDPWADERDGRWYVADSDTLASLADALRSQGERSRDIVRSHHLDEIGQPGPRWDGAQPATLERILFHLLQEYARHCGQLDVVAELSGGATGE